jgi:hypothetical protein
MRAPGTPLGEGSSGNRLVVDNAKPRAQAKEPIMLAQIFGFRAFAEIISRTFFLSAFWFAGT